MDGFEMKDNIILIAPPTVPTSSTPLCSARDARRQIVVDRPDRNGRRKILEVHSKESRSRRRSTSTRSPRERPASPAPISRT